MVTLNFRTCRDVCLPIRCSTCGKDLQIHSSVMEQHFSAVSVPHISYGRGLVGLSNQCSRRIVFLRQKDRHLPSWCQGCSTAASRKPWLHNLWPAFCCSGISWQEEGLLFTLGVSLESVCDLIPVCVCA